MGYGWFGYPATEDPDLPIPKTPLPQEERSGTCNHCKKDVDLKGLYVLSHLGMLHVECLTTLVSKDIVRVLGEKRGIKDGSSDRAKREEAEREIDDSILPSAGQGIF